MSVQLLEMIFRRVIKFLPLFLPLLFTQTATRWGRGYK
jgi:hypothetical protein